jgi:uncharacterized protein (TIGR00369 family)
MAKLEAPVDDGRCIGCGPLSEGGLKMTFERGEDGLVTSHVVVPPAYQGWRGVVHGGVVALVLDEAMAYAAGARGAIGVTAEMKLRFRGSVPTGEPLVVTGKVLWQRRNVLGVEASVRDEHGTLLASATGSFVQRGTLEPGATFSQLR